MPRIHRTARPLVGRSAPPRRGAQVPASRRTTSSSCASPGPIRTAPRARRPSRCRHSLPRSTTGYNINVATTTLDSANARTFSSFTRGGGMGLDEMTGSPNLAIVPDPGTFRLLPWAPKVALGAVRRIFHQRRAVSFLAAATAAQAGQAARRQGHGCVVGLEIEWYLLRVADPHLTDEHTGIPGVRGRPVRTAPAEPGFSYHSEIQHGPDAAGASRRSPKRSRRSGCRCARSRTSGARASSNARSRRGRRWKRPTTRCCSAPPRGRSAGTWAISRPSWRARRSRATIRAAGTCTSP